MHNIIPCKLGCQPADIAGATFPVACRVVKSLEIRWRLGSHRSPNELRWLHWKTGCHDSSARTRYWKLTSINSLAPGKFEWNFRYLILQIISVIDGWGIPCELALRWMSLDFTDDKSTLVQVMAWCRQATSHYLSQCWPRSLPPYGVTRSRWVNRGYFWPINQFRIGNSNSLLRACATVLVKEVFPFWWQQSLPGGREQLLLYPLLQGSWKGGILVSCRLSVRPSVDRIVSTL